jgi:hypothetical protein
MQKDFSGPRTGTEAAWFVTTRRAKWNVAWRFRRNKLRALRLAQRSGQAVHHVRGEIGTYASDAVGSMIHQMATLAAARTVRHAGWPECPH